MPARLLKPQQKALNPNLRPNPLQRRPLLPNHLSCKRSGSPQACLRLKGLLDHVAPELLSQSPYRIFQEVHDKLEHMPTHRARQATDTRFVEKMDKERFNVEKAHADEIRRAATAIRHHAFEEK